MSLLFNEASCGFEDFDGFLMKNNAVDLADATERLDSGCRYTKSPAVLGHRGLNFGEKSVLGDDFASLAPLSLRGIIGGGSTHRAQPLDHADMRKPCQKCCMKRDYA